MTYVAEWELITEMSIVTATFDSLLTGILMRLIYGLLISKSVM